jgi:ABC-type polysaccharide/polyol phosphate transport system ATPase subunit
VDCIPAHVRILPQKNHILGMKQEPFIALSEACVQFPSFTSRSRGLLNTIIGKGRERTVRFETGGLEPSAAALSNLNITIKAGERVALIGSNGAGKTTLLRVLSGAYEPTSGNLAISGNVSALTDLMLGMDPEANGYEFIRTRSIMLGVSKNDLPEIQQDIVRFTELGEYLTLPVRTYSSGMLLRLAFAVATSVKPDILLMDEMIGVGDSRFMARADERLHRLMESVQILVLASHNETILKRFCNRGLLLHRGRVLADGEIDEVLRIYSRGSMDVVATGGIAVPTNSRGSL